MIKSIIFSIVITKYAYTLMLRYISGLNLTGENNDEAS